MADTVRVSPVSSKPDFNAFLTFPWRIYRGDPNWVPPLLAEQKGVLDTKKNPFYLHSEIQHFLARRGRQMVGRISAIVDHNFNDFQGTKTGFFGFFESIDDREVAGALMEAASAWVRGRGMNRIMGPTNPGTNHVLAMLVDGFDSPPVLQMPYNPRYYVDLVGACGLGKAQDLFAYYMEDIVPISEKIRRVADLIRKRKNVTVRPINMKKRDQELALVKVVYNDAWERNWGFVPWTDQELDHLWDDLKTAADPEMVFFAFVDGEVAGFSLTLPDLNQALRRINGRLFPFGLLKLLWYARKIDMVRVLALGVRKKFHNMGLDAVLLYETYSRGTKQGFHRGEFSWILENNLPMRNALENWGARIYKTYRLFDKAL